MTYTKVVDMTHLVPERKHEDEIIFNHNPHISDIEKARDNNQIIICNNPSDYTLDLISDLSDDLKMYIVLYDTRMIDTEFEEFFMKRYKETRKINWMKIGY